MIIWIHIEHRPVGLHRAHTRVSMQENAIMDYNAIPCLLHLSFQAKIGRIRILRCFGGTVYVGPHWCCSFVMLSVTWLRDEIVACCDRETKVASIESCFARAV